MEKEKVIYTNDIPQCPYCKKPTKRSGGDGWTTTCVYYPPMYDENGVNTNPDRNTSSTSYSCEECGKSYVISGNDYDGYKYN